LVRTRDLSDEAADHNARALAALMMRRPTLPPAAAESAELSAALAKLRAEVRKRPILSARIGCNGHSLSLRMA
jgi:hypothetical protein